MFFLFTLYLVLTFVWIFTNSAMIVAYKRIFDTLFDLVHQLTGSPVQFSHIHKVGWDCIVANLDHVQAKGLGLILNEIDKTKNWKDHLLYIFKSCQVHYKR